MLLCMRTTIDVNDALLRRAKQRAAKDGTTLRELVEAALRRYLAGGGAPRREYELRWRAESGQLLPGVRIEDRDALLDILDGRR
jgi:Arc/MetJ family transcription regulator